MNTNSLSRTPSPKFWLQGGTRVGAGPTGRLLQLSTSTSNLTASAWIRSRYREVRG